MSFRRWIVRFAVTLRQIDVLKYESKNIRYPATDYRERKLYLINTVFISAATILTAYFLKFPVKKYVDSDFERKAKDGLGGYYPDPRSEVAQYG